MRKKIITFYHNFINKGTELNTDTTDKRLIKVINFIGLSIILLFYPFIVIMAILKQNSYELLLLAVFFILLLYVLGCNRKGHAQRALIAIAITIICTSFFAVFLNKIQTTAPTAALITGLLGFFFIKNRLWKYAVFCFGFSSYAFLNYYQTVHYEFNIVEYILTLGVLLIFAYGIRFMDQMKVKYEKLILKQVNDLNTQNEIIKTKSAQLLQLEAEKHKSEIALQQKDLEMVLANNLVQIQLSTVLIEKLKASLKSESTTKDIKKIILDLRQQNEINEKMNLAQKNMEKVNLQFFDRLLLKHPNITRTDKEFCSYIRLGLSSKEIATVRNTTVNTVNVAKTRLRKKMGLASNQNIAAYLSTF